jgi:hypothetical protein
MKDNTDSPPCKRYDGGTVPDSVPCEFGESNNAITNPDRDGEYNDYGGLQGDVQAMHGRCIPTVMTMSTTKEI